MRVVNLARRPFINRRPIVRFAALLWLAGILLLGWNLRLYRGHWQGTAENRRLLDEALSQLETERQSRDRLARQLARIDLGEQNRKSAFLNSLISYRTFPWSALFDDLEEVLPAEVKVFSVQPVVRLATEVARENRLAARRRSAAERSANRRSSRRRGGTTGAPPATEDERPPAPTDPLLAPDEVALQLNGQAKTEDDLIELVDRLFENPTFRRPVLGNEFLDPNEKMTGFSLSVVYLTRRPPVVAPEDPAAAELATELSTGAGTPAAGSPGAGTPAAGSPAAGSPGAAGSQPTDPSDRGTPRSGVDGDTSVADTSGRDTSGRDGSDSDTSDSDTPGRSPADRGTPTAGVPVAGTVAGVPAGDPSSRGTPGTGTPGAGTPAARTLDSPPPPGPGTADDEDSRAQGRLADSDPTDSAADRDGRETERDTPGEDDETGLREDDASATPAVDSGGQVRLAPELLHLRWRDRDRPGLVRFAVVGTRTDSPRVTEAVA